LLALLLLLLLLLLLPRLHTHKNRSDLSLEVWSAVQLTGYALHETNRDKYYRYYRGVTPLPSFSVCEQDFGVSQPGLIQEKKGSHPFWTSPGRGWFLEK